VSEGLAVKRGPILSKIKDNEMNIFIGENGSAKVCHGSGGIVLLRAE
jgi:hypothetical protein